MSFHKFDNSDPVEVYNTWFKDHDEHLKPKEKDARMVWIEQELEKLLEEKRQKAIEISTEKIFTQEDFEKIKAEQIRKKLTDKNFVKTKDKGRLKNIAIDSDSESEEAKAAKR